MKKMKVFSLTAVFLSVLCLAGCGLVKSPYTVDYSIISDCHMPCIQATIKGPAAELAVILTNPQGKSELNSDVQHISKEQMISNSRTVKMWIERPQAGKWTLTVKTVDPEKVVYREEIALTIEDLVKFAQK